MTVPKPDSPLEPLGLEHFFLPMFGIPGGLLLAALVFAAELGSVAVKK